MLSLITINALAGSERMEEMFPRLCSTLSCNILEDTKVLEDGTERDEDSAKKERRRIKNFKICSFRILTYIFN